MVSDGTQFASPRKDRPMPYAEVDVASSRNNIFNSQIANVESIRKMHIFNCGVHQKNAHFPITFGHQLWLCPMGYIFEVNGFRDNVLAM